MKRVSANSAAMRLHGLRRQPHTAKGAQLVKFLRPSLRRTGCTSGETRRQNASDESGGFEEGVTIGRGREAAVAKVRRKSAAQGAARLWR